MAVAKTPVIRNQIRRLRFDCGEMTQQQLADQVGVDIGLLLAEMGEIRTGTPLDWLPLSGIGGA